VWEYITGLRDSAEMTMLMTTHYMDEADTYCDRIALMHHGAIRAGGWAEGPVSGLRRLASRIVTLCWVELRKIRHDRTELYTRAIQPALWLLIYGETFTRIHAIPTPGGIGYLAYLSPGILAQSALFIAIFYGIQIIWERDAGVLAKLMVTPTPRAALITGKAFAAGVRSVVQGVVVVILSAILGVPLLAAGRNRQRPVARPGRAGGGHGGGDNDVIAAAAQAGQVRRRLERSGRCGQPSAGEHEPPQMARRKDGGGAAAQAGRGRGHRVLSVHRADGGTARRGAAA
jgi:energy-coupling factor transporter ATP-binding protein EcfA2